MGQLAGADILLNGGAGESRTPDLQFRKLPLYPAELQPRSTREFNAN
jgi:hypothetical protein